MPDESGRNRPGHDIIVVGASSGGVDALRVLVQDCPATCRRPLYRTAAASRGGRVIGVVLSGALNDGTAGLRAIKRCCGLAVVQHPADASTPSMPESALRHVAVDHVAVVDAMGQLLNRLAHEPASDSGAGIDGSRRQARRAVTVHLSGMQRRLVGD